MAAIGAVIGLAGSAVSAMGTLAGGRATRKAAERQAELDRILGQRKAEELRIQANTVQATGQQNALQTGLKVADVLSTARANAGASGGGVSDTSVLNVESMISHVGAFQKAMQVFSGENEARGLRYRATLAEIGGQNQAAADIFEGQVAEQNAQGAAIGGILGGFGGLFKGLS